jgi:hypothetical protein
VFCRTRRMIVIYLPIFIIKGHKVLENTEIWGMHHDEFNKIIKEAHFYSIADTIFNDCIRTNFLIILS